MNRNTCSLFEEQDDVEEYLIEYRGNLLEQMENIDYACAFTLTSKLAILAVKDGRLGELKMAVPAIIFVNFRNKYVLEGTSVSEVSNIQPLKINPYLFLTGRGVIIGIVDTGIDYTNKEFLREDDTSRIEVIWDQTINSPNPNTNQNANTNFNTSANPNLNTNTNFNTSANPNLNTNTNFNTSANPNLNTNTNFNTSANPNLNTNTNFNTSTNANINSNQNTNTNTNQNSNEVFTGTIYDNDEINEAVKANLSGKDPYAIVPSRDEIGHGTQMASIAGARGYDSDVAGVANDCTFAIVKLKESNNLKKQLENENITDVPVYHLSSIIAGIEYLKNYALRVKKPMIILNSIGTSEHSHDSSDVFSRYLSEIASYRGLVFVASVGNEGIAEGHASGYLTGVGDIKEVELKVGESMNLLKFTVYVRRPNKVSIAVISPTEESSEFMTSNLYKEKTIDYILEETTLTIDFYNWDNITGLQTFVLSFSNIKPGIWKIRLRGEYIVDGRFDIWLPPAKTLKPGIKFLNPDPNQTINLPGASDKVISVSYYNQNNNSILSESGRGFPLFPIIKPDIAAPGVDIFATSIGGSKVTVTGSSAAASIVAGACALLVQWGIVDGNDTTMYVITVLSYLTAGAHRDSDRKYPNESLGYGTLDLLGTFERISGLKLDNRKAQDYDGYIEYYVNSLYVRIPRNMEVRFVEI